MNVFTMIISITFCIGIFFLGYAIGGLIELRKSREEIEIMKILRKEENEAKKDG